MAFALWRVLRDDGTFWLNVGDGFNGSGSTGGQGKQHTSNGSLSKPDRLGGHPSLKQKDLCMIPARVALALQADGWCLRQEITWLKVSPMPDPTRDRPTSATEKIYLFAKSTTRERTIAFVDVDAKLFHFGKYGWPQSPDMWLCDLCVGLATALFDRVQFQNDFSLPPFYAEEWKHLPDRDSGGAIANLPAVYFAAAYASSRFLNADMTTKEFLGEIYGLWGDLRQTDFFVKGQRLPSAHSGRITMDRDAAIAVDNAGHVRKVDFVHGLIVEKTSTICNRYYYDLEAERVTPAESTIARDAYTRVTSGKDGDYAVQHNHETPTNPAGRNLWNWWALPPENFGWQMCLSCGVIYEPKLFRRLKKVDGKYACACGKIDWLSHYAVFPSSLPRRVIRLATSEHGVCSKCGAPWERQVEKDAGGGESPVPQTGRRNGLAKGAAARSTQPGGTTRSSLGAGKGGDVALPGRRTTGWAPSCSCDSLGAVPAVVYDPFSGSGTTCVEARRLNRRFVGTELNPLYARLSRYRVRSDAPLFNGALPVL